MALLHVTNGDSVALRGTTLGGDVLVWRDVLHSGPSLEQRDARLVEALSGGAQVVLWFEHDLYDQLQLVDILSLAREIGLVPELIVVGSFPGRPSFRGLGELEPDELETLWPARVPATAETLAAATDAWHAVRAPDPSALAAAATGTHAGLPFLAAAFRRLLAELPSPRDGLSATERFALQAIADGAATRTAAFVASQELEEAPFLGDTWFFDALDALRSLVAVSPELRLTADGERVLAGELDRVELLGIDRWVGGTHVTQERVWRWDPVAAVLVEP